MYQIPDGAIARLVMVNGSLVSEAEVAQILESYNYQQESNNPNRWVLMDGPADGNAALVFSNEGEITTMSSNTTPLLRRNRSWPFAIVPSTCPEENKL